jgi:hypothetical protein
MLLRVMVIALVLASLTFGQSTRHRHGKKVKADPSYSSSRTASTELLRLARKLRAGGASVALTKEKVSQPFFSARGRIMKTNGEAVQVFQYLTPSAADADARRVSADGSTIGTSKPMWMATPHFFKSGNLIVLYVGANQTILELLQTSLGDQFAGG